MWPHEIVIGVDQTAITVASDTPEFIASLKPWRIDLETEVVDYVLQLEPPRAEVRRGHRYLPRLRHGSCDLFRIRDVDLLERVTRRVLASFAPVDGANQVRVGLMPIVGNGQALLVPPAHGGALSQRWYESHGLEPLYAVSSVLDVEKWEVQVDAGLGDVDAVRTWFPVVDWWLPSADPSAELSPGHAVAQVMRLTDVPDAGRAKTILNQVANAVTRHMPDLAPVAPDYVIEQLDPQSANTLRASLGSALLSLLTAS